MAFLVVKVLLNKDLRRTIKFCTRSGYRHFYDSKFKNSRVDGSVVMSLCATLTIYSTQGNKQKPVIINLSTATFNYHNCHPVRISLNYPKPKVKYLYDMYYMIKSISSTRISSLETKPILHILAFPDLT